MSKCREWKVSPKLRKKAECRRVETGTTRPIQKFFRRTFPKAYPNETKFFKPATAPLSIRAHQCCGGGLLAPGPAHQSQAVRKPQGERSKAGRQGAQRKTRKPRTQSRTQGALTPSAVCALAWRRRPAKPQCGALFQNGDCRLKANVLA